MANSARLALLAALVGAIFLGLWFKGADGPALSGLFALLMTGLAAASVLVSSPGRLALELSRHGFAGLALLGFCAWTLYLGFWPQSGANAHPEWIAAGFYGGYLSIAPHRTLEGLAQLASAPAAFMSAALLVRTRADKDTLGALICLGAILFGGYALLSRLPQMSAGFSRLDVHFGSPNAAALTFAMLSVTAAALAARVARRRIGPKAERTNFAWMLAPIAFGALAFSLAALLLTASRAGIPAGIAALVLFFVLSAIARPLRRGSSWATLAPLALAMALVSIGGVYAWERLDALEPDANLRAELLQAHWRLFQERPLTGHGLNTFHELHQLTMTPDNWRVMRTMGSAHNIFVQTLEETGIIGFSLLGLCVLALALRLFTIVLARESGADWAACALATLVLALVHGLVDFGLQLPALAALVAMLCGAYSSASER